MMVLPAFFFRSEDMHACCCLACYIDSLLLFYAVVVGLLGKYVMKNIQQVNGLGI